MSKEPEYPRSQPNLIGGHCIMINSSEFFHVATNEMLTQRDLELAIMSYRSGTQDGINIGKSMLKRDLKNLLDLK